MTTTAQMALVSFGIIAQAATFALGVLVGSIMAKRKDSIHDNGNIKDPAWWHNTQIPRR
jgi:hypothetical protein